MAISNATATPVLDSLERGPQHSERIFMMNQTGGWMGGWGGGWGGGGMGIWVGIGVLVMVLLVIVIINQSKK